MCAYWEFKAIRSCVSDFLTSIITYQMTKDGGKDL